jgi:hypothetical protein
VFNIVDTRHEFEKIVLDLDFPFLIAPSVFSSVIYFTISISMKFEHFKVYLIDKDKIKLIFVCFLPLFRYSCMTMSK